MGAGVGRGGAAGSELVVAGVAAGGAERAWPAARGGAEEEVGGERRRSWMSPESEPRKRRRLQEVHLRRSPDPEGEERAELS